jgi:WD40 repeat protein
MRRPRFRPSVPRLSDLKGPIPPFVFALLPQMSLYQPSHRLSVDSEARIEALRFSSDGNFLACGTKAGILFVWNPENHDLLYRIDMGHLGGITAIEWDFIRLKRIFVGFDTGATVYIDDFKVRAVSYIELCPCSLSHLA